MGSDVTSTMQAIETYYAGCWFRSRIEARWAVFFNNLGLAWEYEQQGFFVGAGRDTRYLPDFRLPWLGLFLEVKPSPADIVDPEGVKLWEYFAGMVATEWDSGRTAMLCGPIPDPDSVDEYGPPRSYYRYEQPVVMLEDWHAAWCACPTGEHFDIQYQARGGRILCGCPRIQDDRQYLTGNHPRILAAYRAARSARFEHGQRPAA